MEQPTLEELRKNEDDLGKGCLALTRMGEYTLAIKLAGICAELKRKSDAILALDPTAHNGENI